MIKKYPHLIYLLFCRVQFLHTFPDDIWDKYSRENFSYTEVSVLRQHNTFLAQLRFLISNALARAPATEKDTITKGTHFSTGPTTSSRHSTKTRRLVLGLLQVVCTVKTKGTHFSTGPTTSSRHSKILNYRLCLQQFVKIEI